MYVLFINFELTHHRAMTNKIFFKMNQVPNPYGKYCSEIESVIHVVKKTYRQTYTDFVYWKNIWDRESTIT